MRILLFIATNLAVLILLSIVFNLLGLEGILAANGVDLNLGALLVMCAVFGFGGAMISLFLSKWMARRGAGVQLIEQPATATNSGCWTPWRNWPARPVSACRRWASSLAGRQCFRHRLESQQCPGSRKRGLAAALSARGSARGHGP